MRLTAKAILAGTLLIITTITFPVAAGDDLSSQNSLEPNKKQDELLLRTIEYTYIDSFKAADRILDSLLIDYPDYWPARVFQIGVLYAEINDNENTKQLDRFHELIDSTVKGMERYLKQNPDDKWGYFFTGIAMGYWALYEGYHGNWLKAVLKGLAAGKHYSRAIELDSTFYEAYLGLGTLNYWRSAKIGFARNLPFIADRREEGIRQIQLAADSSRYSVLPAINGLAWIYINQKDYRKAIRLMNDLMNKGYRGRQVLWPKGIASFKTGHSKGVIASFTAIKKGLERQGNQNYYNIGLCNYYIGVAHYWRGEYTEALFYLNALLDKEVDKDVAKRLKKKYKKANEYKKKIKEIIAARLEKQRRD